MAKRPYPLHPYQSNAREVADVVDGFNAHQLQAEQWRETRAEHARLMAHAFGAVCTDHTATPNQVAARTVALFEALLKELI